MRLRTDLFAWCAALLLTGASIACQDGQAQEEVPPAIQLGLFSSLPIFWGEGDDFAAMLDSKRAKGEVRQVLEQDFTLVPLDAIEAEHLAGLNRLMLAQPRPLAPSENVALDNWVRGGGRVLIFADPMLTHHSGYALGDRRRPQDMVLISPILARWGLELRFDEGQPAGPRELEAFGLRFPVEQAGHFALRAGGGQASRCTISDNGILAQCEVGEGRVTVFADAALLEEGEGPDADAHDGERARLLGDLLTAALNS